MRVVMIAEYPGDLRERLIPVRELTSWERKQVARMFLADREFLS